MAEEPATPAGVSIELNAVEDRDGACRMSFVVENDHGSDLTEAVYETVLFDTEGAVVRLTLFDFRDLPKGRPRVRQFQIDGLGCHTIDSVLINGAESCTGAGLPPDACMEGLTLKSRVSIELIG